MAKATVAIDKTIRTSTSVRAIDGPARAWGVGRAHRVFAFAVPCVLLVGACGTAPMDTSPEPLVVALGLEPDAAPPAQRFHESVLAGLREAWVERDLERMDNLLSTSRAGATPEQVESYTSYDVLVASAFVETAGFQFKGFRFLNVDTLDGGRVPPDLELSQEAPLELRIQAQAGASYRIPRQEADAVTRFVITTHFEDYHVDGSVARSATPYRFSAQRDLVITDDEPFVIPLPTLPTAPDGVLFRKLRVEGVLFCAAFYETLESGTEARMLPRLELESLSAMQFLAGFRTSKVRSAPLEVLTVAAQEPGRFAPHLLTASFFVARDGVRAEKDRATGLLVEALRRSSAAAKAIMAALLLVVGEDEAPKLRDRDAWLRWWDLRRMDAVKSGAMKSGPAKSK